MSQFGSLKACWLSCALHLLHSMHSNISVGQLGVITAHDARKADLGCGTNLYMWDHRRVTELDDKLARRAGCSVAGKNQLENKRCSLSFHMNPLCLVSEECNG